MGIIYLFIGFDIHHNKFDYNDQQQEQNGIIKPRFILGFFKKIALKQNQYTQHICG
jgi:hypothetical protein